MAKQISDIPEAIQDRLDRTPAQFKIGWIAHRLSARTNSKLDAKLDLNR